jgi:hypothetical protein
MTDAAKIGVLIRARRTLKIDVTEGTQCLWSHASNVGLIRFCAVGPHVLALALY